jgi:hypothetical protein
VCRKAYAVNLPVAKSSASRNSTGSIATFTKATLTTKYLHCGHGSLFVRRYHHLYIC